MAYCADVQKNKDPGIGIVVLTFPIPGFVSVVSFADLGLSGDGIDFTPGSALGGVNLSLFLFGKLLIGYKFFHNVPLHN